MDFNEFHASVTKQMPDAVKYPEMYALCYRLMKITWDAAYQEDRLKAVPDFSDDEGWEDRSAIQGINPGLAELIKERQEAIARESIRQETLSREEKAKIVGAWHDYHGA